MDIATISAEPQHMRALERANKVRLARADLKRRVAAGKVRAVDIIVDCPWESQSMKISDLLLSQRRWGKTRCRKFLLHIGLSENKPIGDLTERQRMALSALLTSKTSSGVPAPPPDPFRDRRFAMV